MCMEYDRELTVDSVFQNEQEKMFYKLTTPERTSPFTQFNYSAPLTYTKGETVTSNRDYPSLTEGEIKHRSIYNGIHLCCDQAEAIEAIEYIKTKYMIDCIIVPVSVKLEDFVAAGCWSELPELNCIVATQCTVLE